MRTILSLALLIGLTCVCKTNGQIRGTTKQIFDGSSLKGWVNAQSEPVETGWTVVDGTLYRQSRGGDLFYEEQVGDFELSFQWKTTVNGNSGVKYRVRQYGNQWLGCEYQIQDDQGRELNKHAAGGLYAVYEPQPNKFLQPVGQWNQSRIVVFDNQIEHWLNGQKIVDAVVGSDDWHQRVEKSKFRSHEGFGQNAVGRIFLQDHGTEVWFRDIALTPLYNASVADSNPATGECNGTTVRRSLRRTACRRTPSARCVRRGRK